MVPFNDLSRFAPILWADVCPLWSESVSAGGFILGPAVRRFEELFSTYLGGGDTIGVASGTDALELSLRAVGVTVGSRVALAANAGFYASCAVLAIGAEPIFVDVGNNDVVPSDHQIAGCLTGGGVDAVVITHLYGRVATDIEAIAVRCSDAGVPLVEDCSQAHGARLGDRFAGAFGAVAAFSFYPTKNLGAFGDAGAVFTRSSAIAERARRLRQYGWSSKYTVTHRGGRNSRLDELQAIVLAAALGHLDDRNEKRRRIVDHYRDSAPSQTILSIAPLRSAWVGHLCVIEVPNRESVREQLRHAGISTDVHFPVPDHLQPALGDCDVRLPRTEALARSVISVPCFPDMYDYEIDHVARALAALS